jgi:hypothetical protein
MRWINKIESYFDYRHILDDEEKISIASMHLNKLSCDWFLWWNSKSQGLARDWDTLKINILFQDIEEDDFFVKLAQLEQNGTIEEYFDELYVLATHVTDILDKRLYFCKKTFQEFHSPIVVL